MVRSTARGSHRVDLQMTPLIDVVFQLLTFFLMTFRIAAAEGDIELRLPRADDPPSAGRTNSLEERIHVRLTADAAGDLATLDFAGRSAPRGAAAFAALHAYVVEIVAAARSAGAPDPVVELDVDDALRYENVVAAVTAVARQVDDRGEIAPLAGKVTFKRRNAAAAP